MGKVQPSLGGHPLLDEILAGLHKNERGGFVFDESFLTNQTKRAERIAVGRELYLLVGDLTKLAAIVQTKFKSPAAAASLFEMAARLAPRLVELAQKDAAHPDEATRMSRRRSPAQRRRVSVGGSQPRGLAPAAGGVALRPNKKGS